MERYKILIVDDEINILNTLKRLLRNEDLEVIITTSQGVALDHLRNSEIALLISDQKMPHMEGLHLLETAKKVSPKTLRMMITGYADTQTALKAINVAGVYRFLTKPWIDAELVTVVRDAIKTYSSTIKSSKLLQLMADRGEIGQDESLNSAVTKHIGESLQDLNRWEDSPRDRPNGFIEMMRKTLHFNAPDISSHCQRVASLAIRMGQKLDLKVQECVDLEIAASLHDLGKVGLPPEFFNLPPKSLSPYQQNLLDSHPNRGAQLFFQVPGMKPIAQAIEHHHEAFDGSGFPHGLKGTTIPLASRIIYAADSYDKALSGMVEGVGELPGHALDYMENYLTAKLDPEVFAALKECILIFETSKEVNIETNDLKPGMILSRELRTAANVLLFAEFTSLTDFQIEMIKERQEIDPVIGGVFIHKT